MAAVRKKKMTVSRMKQREQQAALPSESLRVLLEVLAFRGYMPEEVEGVTPGALAQLQDYVRSCVPGRQVPILSDLPVTDAALAPFMAITHLNIRPVIVARVRQDAPPWSPARVAGDAVGSLAWVIMARAGGTFTYIPAKPGDEEKWAAARAAGKRVQRPEPRTQVSEALSIKVVRTLLSKFQGEVGRVIVVTVGRPGPTAFTTLMMESGRMQCEVFTFQETQGNPLRHCLTPPHEILRPYHVELRHVQDLRRRKKPWRPKWSSRLPAWARKSARGRAAFQSAQGYRKRRTTATPTTRSDPLTPQLLGMSDMIARVLALPEHTVLRVWEGGVGTTVDPSLCITRYMPGEPLRCMAGRAAPLLLPEEVTESEDEGEGATT